MQPSRDTFRLFGINGSMSYAKKVADHLGVPLIPIREKQFSDGEVMACPDENVRGCDCYFILDPYSDPKMTVNDKIMMAFVFIDALRRASARSVIWVKRPPAYDRQDRKTKPREPVTTGMMGKLLDSLYLDRLITLDPHSLVATNNMLRRGNVDVLQARQVMADAIVAYIDNPDDLVIQAPDEGAVNRHVKPARKSLEKRLSAKFGKEIRIPMTYFDKEHAEDQEEVTGDLIIGDVKGKKVIVWDDMFGTGGTVDINRRAIEVNGGKLYIAVATHGYFTMKKNRSADQNFDGVEHIFITDSMDGETPWRLDPVKMDGEGRKLAKSFLDRLHVVDTSKFMAEVLWETDNGGSINKLLQD